MDLKDLVKSLYSSFYTDLKISPASGKTITVTPEQLQKLKGISGIKNFSLVVEEKALFTEWRIPVGGLSERSG